MRIVLTSMSTLNATWGELTRETFDERCRPGH
jgi:hypothetical protein